MKNPKETDRDGRERRQIKKIKETDKEKETDK